MRATLLLQTALLMVLLGAGAFAASPVDVFEFETPEQEQRYRVLIDELRCPKCMNVNIAGSDAPIANSYVTDRVQAGLGIHDAPVGDDQIIDLPLATAGRGRDHRRCE